MEPEIVQFVFPARLQYVEAAESLLASVLSTLDLDDDIGHDMRLSVHEALVNAWKHGAQEDPTVSISLRLLRLPDGLDVEVEDQGQGFDPKQVGDPTSHSRLLASQGRGIFLMRQLVDSVEISSSRGGPTRVFLSKKWPDGQQNGIKPEGRNRS